MSVYFSQHTLFYMLPVLLFPLNFLRLTHQGLKQETTDWNINLNEHTYTLLAKLKELR